MRPGPAPALALRPAREDDYEFVFRAKREAVGAYVAQTWGWDEDVQHRFHHEAWSRHRPDIVELAGVAIGTINVIQYHDHVYIAEFYLLTTAQRQGYGSRILAWVLADADAARVPVRLQFLKVNPVRSLYERHGFVVSGESKTHWFAERSPAIPVSMGT